MVVEKLKDISYHEERLKALYIQHTLEKREFTVSRVLYGRGICHVKVSSMDHNIKSLVIGNSKPNIRTYSDEYTVTLIYKIHDFDLPGNREYLIQ